MKRQSPILTGLLLVTIGVLAGIIITMAGQHRHSPDRPDVRFTEVKYSRSPAISADSLQELGGRFLFRKIARQVTPSVVYIEALVPAGQADVPSDRYHEEGFFDLFRRRARAVGSGVIISPDGYILTNSHVVKGAADDGIRIILNDKRTFSAVVEGSDPSTDLAVLKVDAHDLPAIVMGNPDLLEVGEWVLAVGNPFRLRSTVTAGIVSAKNREVDIIDDRMRIESFIQTDAAINVGNSGGALVNTSGELVGINTAIASRTGNYQGYGFAVPADLAGKVARDLIEYGKVRRALLGVSITGVDAGRAEQLGMDRIHGVEIGSATAGGAASRAGVKPGDIILRVNGKAVDEPNELQREIGVLQPGDTVDLSIWRNGAILEKQAILSQFEEEKIGIGTGAAGGAELKSDRADPPAKVLEPLFFPELGFEALAIPPAEGEERPHVLVSRVEPRSQAERAGLERGYLIMLLNGEKVEDLETLTDLVGRHRSRYPGGGEPVSIRVKTLDDEIETIHIPLNGK